MKFFNASHYSAGVCNILAQISLGADDAPHAGIKLVLHDLQGRHLWLQE